MKKDELLITKIGCLFRKPKIPVIGDFNGHIAAINDMEDTVKIVKSIELVGNTPYSGIQLKGTG